MELRVKVAELCGWKPAAPGVTGELRWQFEPGGCFCYINALPDYPNDLNACHEFEKAMFGGHRGAYFYNLGEILGQTVQPQGWYDAWILGTATAEQRCRAFVATMEVRKAAEKGS